MGGSVNRSPLMSRNQNFLNTDGLTNAVCIATAYGHSFILHYEHYNSGELRTQDYTTEGYRSGYTSRTRATRGTHTISSVPLALTNTMSTCKYVRSVHTLDTRNR